MQVFVWEGKNRNNIVQKGEMEATGVDMVRSYLNRLRITPTKIKKKAKRSL
jgi:type IV pilus assembly protein PilC